MSAMRGTVMGGLLLTVAPWGMAVAVEQQLPMKLDYAKGVIMESASAQRIEASDHAEAKAKLEEARALYAEARQAQADGDFERSDELASQALRLVTVAAQMVPNRVDEQAQQRARYEDLLKQLDSYQDWGRKFESRDGGDSGVDLDDLARRVDEAKGLAEGGDYAKANDVLGQLLDAMVRGSSDAIGSRTFTYDLDFATPIDEYNYELERNNDYRRLIPVAMSQKAPTAGVQSLVQRYQEQGERLRSDAEEQFAAKTYERAVQLMQESTEKLVSALKLMGVR